MSVGEKVVAELNRKTQKGFDWVIELHRILVFVTRDKKLDYSEIYI